MAEGDSHIYHPTNGETPEALCGYSPELDDDDNVILPVSTGDNCSDCLDVVQPTTPEEPTP